MICVSGAVFFSQVKSRVNFRFEDLGTQKLKIVAEPVHVYRVVPSGSGPEHGPMAWFDENLPISKKPSIAILPFANLLIALIRS
jgi:adenylate cyclase